jgi:hypothetical protein
MDPWKVASANRTEQLFVAAVVRRAAELRNQIAKSDAIEIANAVGQLFRR